MILLDALQIFSGCKEPEYQGVVMSSKRRLFHKKKSSKRRLQGSQGMGLFNNNNKNHCVTDK
jgi:hypothetical protein